MFIDALQRRATVHPDGWAVLREERRLTNLELWRETAWLGAWLVRQGLGPGDAVGITIRDEFLNLLVTLAAFWAGLPQVALPTFDPAAYRRATAERLKLSAVLAERPEDGIPGIPTVVVEAAARGAEQPDTAPSAGLEGPALYIATSGTTGRPKIIPLSQRQLLLQGINFQGITPPRPEILYRPTSIEFNSSRKQRLYCLAYGGTNALADAQRSRIIDTCRQLGVTELGVSAAQARTLVDGLAQNERLPDGAGLRLVGSPVAQRLRRELMERLSPRLSVGYGASEFGAVATAGPDDHDRHPASVGMVHRGVDLEVVDEDDRPVPAGVSGRIRLRSEGMATAYYDDDEATAAAFRGGWFYPGDVGHLGEAGDLRFDGRSDDMMVLASINIFPAEIERVAEAFPGVVECAAFSMESSEFGEIPLLAVVTDGTARPEAILAETRKALGLRAPRKVFVVDALPRNPAGKVQRRALRHLAGTPPGGGR